jgi:hypothetical protein
MALLAYKKLSKGVDISTPLLHTNTSLTGQTFQGADQWDSKVTIYTWGLRLVLKQILGHQAAIPA